jgi:hypothetical protein
MQRGQGAELLGDEQSETAPIGSRSTSDGLQTGTLRSGSRSRAAKP